MWTCRGPCAELDEPAHRERYIMARRDGCHRARWGPRPLPARRVVHAAAASRAPRAPATAADAALRSQPATLSDHVADPIPCAHSREDLEPSCTPTSAPPLLWTRLSSTRLRPADGVAALADRANDALSHPHLRDSHAGAPGAPAGLARRSSALHSRRSPLGASIQVEGTLPSSRSFPGQPLPPSAFRPSPSSHRRSRATLALEPPSRSSPSSAASAAS
jgi:hypothetical protein